MLNPAAGLLDGARNHVAPLIIRPSDDWSYEIAKGDGSGRKAGGDVEMVCDELIKVYDYLAGGAPEIPPTHERLGEFWLK